VISPQRAARAAIDDLIHWRRYPATDFAGLPPLASWDRRLERLLPYVFAISAGIQARNYLAAPELIGYDARLYVAAARAWLAGGDPWSVSTGGIHFGAPPPTLLAYVPLTPLADWLVTAIAVLGSFALAILAIRALGLKGYWIFFWPIFTGAMVGSLDVAVLALLVLGRQRLAWLAPILKLYAAFPLASMRSWRSIAGAAVILLLTAPVLPWATWWADLPSITQGLERFAVTTSVAGNLPLMAIGGVALLALGVRRAGWLLVPVLWPWTQAHYLALSVPVLTPTLAILWSLPGPPPLVMLGSVVLAAVGFRFFPQARSREDIEGIGLDPIQTADVSAPAPARSF
jgi:hypothetical protein